MKTSPFSKVVLVLCAVLLTFPSTPSAQTLNRESVTHSAALPASGGPSTSTRILDPGSAAQSRVLQSYGKLPLSFEVNQGQTDPRVKFLSRGPDYTLFLTGDEAVLSLHPGEANQESQTLSLGPEPRNTITSLRMQVLGANPKASVSGVDELPGKSNYFIGNNPQEWRTNIATYAKVRYHGVYPGVDLVYYGNQQQLEYDFVVAPGGDPSSICLKLQGAEKPRIDKNGDLLLGAARFQRPLVYQETDGRRTTVRGDYRMMAANTVSFIVAEYDRSKPLVIDPVLSYSTYLGGIQGDGGASIAVDSSGNAYITGSTSSANFPTANALQPALAGEFNAFVTKLNASGSALVYSTYLGGSSDDGGTGIAIDSSGNAYITGSTSSANFPTANALQPALAGEFNAFITKLNASGSALVYSTYLGGSFSDQGNGIAVDSLGNAYVTGLTSSTNFPTANALQPALAGDVNAFVTKVNASGSALVYSTYLGGNQADSARGIAVDSSGNAYVTGLASSPDFPTVAPFQPSLACAFGNVFVSKFNASGSALIYSTYLGGSGGEDEGDFGTGIAVDGSGNAYLTGFVSSTNFPTMNAFQPSLGGASGNAFVSKFNASGTALVYSTYLGGSGTEVSGDEGLGIAVDDSGNAYVVGWTSSTNFPTANAVQPAYGGGSFDAFVTEFNSTGSALIYSTFLGGSNYDAADGIAVDSSGNAYVTGETESTNFPTANAFQPTYGGGAEDAFITKIAAVTYPSLISLVRRDVSDRLVAETMVITLQMAEIAANKGDSAAANLLLKAFIDEVSAAESAKLVTAANAAVLIQDAQALMQDPKGR
jgi:hypothetical protein